MPTISSTTIHLPDEKNPFRSPSDNVEMDAWRVTLTYSEGPQDFGLKRTMNVTFFVGVGNRKKLYKTKRRNGVFIRDTWSEGVGAMALYAMPPTTGDVLECLASDATYPDEYTDFEGFAYEMGYVDNDETLRVARRTWTAIHEQTAELRELLGEFFDDVLYKAPDDGWSSVKGDIILTRDEVDE